MEYLNRISPLEELNIRTFTQIPLDITHLVDLGVTREFLQRIVSNDLRHNITKENI